MSVLIGYLLWKLAVPWYVWLFYGSVIALKLAKALER